MLWLKAAASMQEFACRLPSRVVVFIAILFTWLATARVVPAADETATLLKQPVAEKEAVVWYVGHDSFAIKTRSHLLIFDYFIYGDPPPSPSLANGFVDPKEIQDLNVVVFVSHRDGDHYDKVIWDWKKTVKRITYVLGWDPVMPQEKYIHPQPNETMRIADLEVTAVPATDSGEAFLIKVDGLVIYHGGDDAFWIPPYRECYLRKIDFLSTKTDHVDLFFINWRTCADRATLEEGLWYAVDHLKARTVFPMHLGITPREAPIQELIKDAPTAENRLLIVDKETRGEHFLHRERDLVRP